MTVNELIQKLFDLPDGNAMILFTIDGVAYDLYSVPKDKVIVCDGQTFESFEEVEQVKNLRPYQGRIAADAYEVYLIEG